MKPRVMICIPTSEMARRADFYDYINMLDKPEYTMMTSSHGQSPARNRNIMIEQALAQDATHCMFIDDDTIPPKDMIPRLLAHDKDIVSGLYLMRNYPHLPIMFDESFDDGRCKFSFLDKGRQGLVEVVNIGLGACLIKTSVFKNMAKPWIRLGEAELDHWCDDISFFNRARKAGYRMYVDLDLPVGHVISAVIFPGRDAEGNWHTVYNTSGPNAFQVPQSIPAKEIIDKQKEGLTLEKAV